MRSVLRVDGKVYVDHVRDGNLLTKIEVPRDARAFRRTFVGALDHGITTAAVFRALGTLSLESNKLRLGAFWACQVLCGAWI
jgi:hypothetical protein